jgi:hypothetical protein
MRLGLLLVCALAGVAQAGPELDALTKTAPGCDAKRTHCLGLALHVAVDDAGAPVATAGWVSKQVEGANLHFESLALEFKIVSIDALPASAARVENRKERDSFAPRVTGTVIHVFVTGYLDDIDIAGNMIYGVAWRVRSASPGSAGARSAAQPRGGTIDTKFIILSTHAWGHTLAHELGHVFGLPHSTYPISIMNKSDRKEPPPEQRTFHSNELVAMKPRLAWLLRSKALQDTR